MRSSLVLLFATGCLADSSSVDGLADPNFRGELLRNGGFESVDAAGAPNEWIVNDTNPGGAIAVIGGGEQLHGDRALRWTIDAGDGYEYFIIQTGIAGDAIEPGRSYELTGAYHFTALGDISFSQAVRGVAGGDPSFGNIEQKSVLPTMIDRWEPFRFAFTMPLDAVPPAEWEVVIDVLKFNGEPLTVTVDGLSLHAQGSKPAD